MSNTAFQGTGLSDDQINKSPVHRAVKNLNGYLPNANTSAALILGTGNTNVHSSTTCLSKNINCDNHQRCVVLGTAADPPSGNDQLCLPMNTTNAAAGAYSNYKIPVRVFDNAGAPLGVKYIHLFNA